MRKISSGLFGLIILLFLLPWNSISCSNQKVITVTGMNLATGKEFSGGLYGTQKIIEGKATVALVVAIVGVLVGFFLKTKVVNMVQTACGWVGGILLCLLKGKLSQEALTQGAGMLTIDYHFGFWASLLLFFAVGIANILSLLGILKKVNFGVIIKDISLKGPAHAVFCSQCGAKVSSESSFCSECGHSLK